MRAMTLVARVTFLVLVGATFSAFFVAQRLKSAPSVITVTGLARHFSPNGDKARDSNEFRVRLKVSDDVTVDVVNLDGDRIKRLADSVSVRAYRPLTLVWDGKTDAGDQAADGQYRLRVALRDEGRSATVQQTMNVDTKAPRAEVCIGFKCSVKAQGNIISQGDREVKIYINRVSPFFATKFRVLRTDDGKPREVTTFTLKRGAHRALWNGLDEAGKPLPPGTYIVQAEVRDKAGNVGISPTEFEQGAVRGRPGLTVRGIAAQPPLRPVTAGQRVEFGVDARGASYRWRVRRVGDTAVPKRGTVDAEAVRKDGSKSPAVLAFRAPEGPSGVYLLELRSGRWHTSVPFLVQAVKRSSVLVVVPAISWLGTDKVDDSPFDGLPNTLSAGSTVRWPRTFVGTGGLPAGFADQVAPLLVFLDRNRIRYDLTSDLDLDLTRNPRASDREGVLFAGSERWITRTLASRLRRYVTDGGRVALFGSETMRRGVRLRVRTSDDSGTLLRATQPTATDPFGARLGKLRTVSAPVLLSQMDDNTDYGLMEGALDLQGFTQFEESAPVTGKNAKLLTGVGQPLTAEEEAAATSSGKEPRELRPALTAVQLGKGTVIRVGLPEWPQRLKDPSVNQVTRNIIDILRGVEPRIRSAR
jgi:flagellar hook assembly protein FlgD